MKEERKRKFSLLETIKQNKYKLIYFGVLIIISIVFYLLLYFFRGKTFIDQIDNSFIVFFSFFLFGCMSIVNNQGMFDAMYYGFSTMFSLFRNENRRYEDLIAYKENKSQKRSVDKINFLFYYFISFIYLIVFLYFYISYKII